MGGAYGTGQRISLPYTRAMVNAAIEGKLDGVAGAPHPTFQVLVPQQCPGVPSEVLDAAAQWTSRPAYEAAAAALATRFRRNFEKFGDVTPEIAAAAPRVV